LQNAGSDAALSELNFPAFARDLTAALITVSLRLSAMI
jgi:hypothetical protein